MQHWAPRRLSLQYESCDKMGRKYSEKINYLEIPEDQSFAVMDSSTAKFFSTDEFKALAKEKYGEVTALRVIRALDGYIKQVEKRKKLRRK